VKITPRSILFFFATLAVFTACEEKDPKSQSPFAVDIGESEIPYLIVSTNNAPVQFVPKIPATLQVYQGKEKVQEVNIGIEYRGKTSYRLSNKKGFNIETKDGDVSFFGFPVEEDFRLLGHIVNFKDKFIFDRTLMYNYIGYEISRSIGRYASRCRFVELQLNDQYLGVYVFAEKLKRDDQRINIKSLNAASTNNSGGYILTIDKADVGDAGIGKPLSYFDNNWEDDARYTAANSFRSRYDIHRNILSGPPYGSPYHAQKYLETYFLYEYPKAEEITSTQKEYIAGYIDQFESALLADNFLTNERTYTNYIDLASFVDFFLLNELCRNVDAYRLSTYLNKDRDGKLAMGPIWDMDIGFDNGDRIPINDWVINYNQHVSQDAWMVCFWWPRLMEDPQFRKAVKERWNALRANELSDAKLTQLIDATVQLLKSNGAIERNYKIWDQGIGVNYDASISSFKNALQQRAAWMNSTIAQF
jgi:hypothetical protein